MIEIAGRVDQSGHFLRAEHGRQSLGGFRKWNVLSQEVPAQCLYEQEAQRGHILTDRGRSQILRLEQMSLILPNLLGPELVRRLVKMLRKIADDASLASVRWEQIRPLEFFLHLAELGHEDLLFP